MKFLLFCAFSFQLLSAFSQEPLVYKGKIGDYGVEVFFESCDPISGELIGKYRYEGKQSFLSLSGELTPPVIYMEEYFKEDTTGYWYIEIFGDSIKGLWIGNNNAAAVNLSYSSGDRSALRMKTEIDYNNEVNASLTGDYEVNIFFINDMWLSEDNLFPEIGYNGGLLTVKEKEDGNIDFVVEVVCGPTYHIAFANGLAIKSSNKYIYKNEDSCSITFSFKDKKVAVESNSSIDCGFGARAYLSHEFIKVSNTPSSDFEGE